MPRIGRKRLTIDIPIVLHEQMKLVTKRYNITLTRLIIKLIVKEMEQERIRGG